MLRVSVYALVSRAREVCDGAYLRVRSFVSVCLQCAYKLSSLCSRLVCVPRLPGPQVRSAFSSVELTRFQSGN